MKKGVVYLTIIAGFAGSAFLSIDIGPFSLFPYRVLLPLLWMLFMLGLLINQGKLNISHIKVKHYLWFLAFWLVYAVLSLAWAADKAEGVRMITSLVMGASVIFFVVFYLSNLNDFRRLYNLWLLILVPMMCIGLWEHATMSHLSTSRLAGSVGGYSYRPTGVFYNENDYATYLALSIPFVVAFIRYNGGLIKRFLGVAILILSLYVLVFTEARANYLALIMGAAFWFLFLLKIKNKIKVLALAGLVVLLLFVALPGLVEDVFETANVQLGSVLNVVAKGAPGPSADVRINLIGNCLIFMVNSGGFGIGAGNVAYYMANFQVYDTHGVTTAHNWWAEILADYGVFVFLGFILFYLGLLTKLYRVHGTLTDTSEKMICEALLVGLVVFFLANASMGSFIFFKPTWMLFAFALGALNYYRLKSGSGKV